MAGTESTQVIVVHFSGTENMQKCGVRFGFLLAAVAVSLRWTLVSPHPLGLEAKEIGINQRLPNYLPSYNGIFSIHALNFSSSTADTPAHAHPIIANASASLSEAEHEEEERPGDQETKLFPEDGTAANEVDYSDDDRQNQQQPDLTTFPQLHVVTHTIGGDVTGDDEADATTLDDGGEGEETAHDETIEDDTTTEQDVATESESLHEGAEDDVEDGRPESEDLFDRLLKTIQGHWLEFVGKMKMSVLDVWKSISTHMMERLETFATNV